MARQRISYQERIARYQVKHGVSYEVARKAAQGTHGKAKVTPTQGAAIVETRSGQAALRTLNQAAREGKRVQITVRTKSGEQRTLFSNKGRPGRPDRKGVKKGIPGASAAWIKEKKIGKNGRSAGAFKGWLGHAAAAAADNDRGSDPAEDIDEEDEIEPEEIDDIQILIYGE